MSKPKRKTQDSTIALDAGRRGIHLGQLLTAVSRARLNTPLRVLCGSQGWNVLAVRCDGASVWLEVDPAAQYGSVRKPGKPFDFWSNADDRASMEEGWLLTNDSDDNVYIARLDDPASAFGLDTDMPVDPVFPYDEDAWHYVLSRAKCGSRRHLLALWLSGRSVEQEIDPPPEELLSEPQA